MASTSDESPASPEVSCKECHNGEPGHMATFKASDTVIELAPTLKAKPDVSELVFGKFFTDHMLTIEWTKAGGWQHPHISPIRQLSLHPGCSALHYAIQGSPTPVLESYCPVRFQSYLASDEPHLFSSKYQEQVWLIRSQLFEGLKAYWGQDGQARLFRPMLNMKRMVVSAKRACLPSFDCEELLECIRKLVKIDQDWIPRSDSASLYIRPTLISTESSLGVKKPTSALLFVILSPVSSYFRTGMKPVSLWADIKYVRAWKGGTGDCKLGGNYGATIYAQYEAENLGCQQVLWLYGDDHQITEVGTMNVFIHWTNEDGEEELATPPLDGLILPGITRQSILELSQKWGEFKVSERYITMADLLRALKENRVKEIFGSGTACVVSPVGCILYQGENLLIPCKEGFPPLASRLLKELIDIQYGRTPSEWSFLV